jgi:hypothetical protein
MARRRAFLIALQEEHELLTIFVLGSQLPVLLLVRISWLVDVLGSTKVIGSNTHGVKRGG